MEKSTFTTYLLDLLFPRHCLHCHKLLRGLPESYLCEACRDFILPSSQYRCAFCRKATVFGKTCTSCRPDHSLDRMLVATDYRDRLTEDLVKTLKYRFVPAVAYDIATTMQRYIGPRGAHLDITPATHIVSIPLHPKRLRWRGFNQADLIARHLATMTSLPYLTDALTRSKSIIPQADIQKREERMKNVTGIFEAPVIPSYDGTKIKQVILIDDVATTGATLDDAARALKGAGVKEVIGFVFARG